MKLDGIGQVGPAQVAVCQPVGFCADVLALRKLTSFGDRLVTVSGPKVVEVGHQFRFGDGIPSTKALRVLVECDVRRRRRQIAIDTEIADIGSRFVGEQTESSRVNNLRRLGLFVRDCLSLDGR